VFDCWALEIGLILCASDSGEYGFDLLILCLIYCICGGWTWVVVVGFV
jgi:hypothetical protein